MGDSVLKIRDKEYRLDKVLLRLRCWEEENDNYLDFDLFADSGDLTKAGFAINSITIQGVTTPQEIAGRAFILDDDAEDELNELRESVICKPGHVLEISHLEIRFGTPVDSYIEVELRATCFAVDEETDEVGEDSIPVIGSFFAQIR